MSSDEEDDGVRGFQEYDFADCMGSTMRMGLKTSQKVTAKDLEGSWSSYASYNSGDQTNYPQSGNAYGSGAAGMSIKVVNGAVVRGSIGWSQECGCGDFEVASGKINPVSAKRIKLMIEEERGAYLYAPDTKMGIPKDSYFCGDDHGEGASIEIEKFEEGGHFKYKADGYSSMDSGNIYEFNVDPGDLLLYVSTGGGHDSQCFQVLMTRDGDCEDGAGGAGDVVVDEPDIDSGKRAYLYDKGADIWQEKGDDWKNEVDQPRTGDWCATYTYVNKDGEYITEYCHNPRTSSGGYSSREEAVAAWHARHAQQQAKGKKKAGKKRKTPTKWATKCHFCGGAHASSNCPTLDDDDDDDEPPKYKGKGKGKAKASKAKASKKRARTK